MTRGSLPTRSPAWTALRGLCRLSLCDWPGRPAMVLFCGGCNLRCPTCHNAAIAWTPELHPALHAADVARLILARRPWLRGLVVSGGEPSNLPDLLGFLGELATVGLPLKLDTNGLRPEVLEQVLVNGLVDLVAVDVKGPWTSYPALTGQRVTARGAQERLEAVFQLARRWPGRFQFRLTRVPLLTDDDIAAVRAVLPAGHDLTLQAYVPQEHSHAQPHSQERRSPGDLVHGAHRRGHPESLESQRGEGSAPVPPLGPEGRSQA